MANTVTVIGFKESGKTCYLAGMYSLMSFGRKNFSIVAKDSDMDLFLDNLWNDISQGKMPLPSDDAEKYTLHIAHNYKPVCDFEWLDYPGGILADPNHRCRPQLESSIENADCMLLILDGRLFQINAADDEEYERKLTNRLMNHEIKSEIKVFNRMSDNKQKIPPIVIVITKTDLINPDYKDTIEKVLHDLFSSVFGSDDADGDDRIVLLTAVSLGEGIERGESPDPFCIEQPIAFAVLVILVKYLAILSMKKEENRNYVRKSRGIIGSLIKSGKIAEAEKNISELNALADKWSKDAFKLIELFPEKANIYINNRKTNLRAYFRDIFSELND